MKIKTDNYEIYKGDCLEVMDKLIKQGIKVDAIITDPPYGTTACRWDQTIPFDEMWGRLNKLIKDDGAIVLFGSEPFSSLLRTSNLKNYRYDWVWQKSSASNFCQFKRQPRKLHELISVFYKKQPTYNPIMEKATKKSTSHKGTKDPYINIISNGLKRISVYDDTGYRYPSSVQFCCNQSGELNNTHRVHPTQKPVPLLEYLIKTYTNEGELVLDFTMGSGSTGVACMNTNRKFIGIELDDKYFEIAENRIKESIDKKEELLKLFDESN